MRLHMGHYVARANPLLKLAACIGVVVRCVLAFDRIVRPRVPTLCWLAWTARAAPPSACAATRAC